MPCLEVIHSHINIYQRSRVTRFPVSILEATVDYSTFTMSHSNGVAIANGTNGHTNDGNLNGNVRSGLKVLIAGAGIGGLTAAIALRQQGHNVEVSPIKQKYESFLADKS